MHKPLIITILLAGTLALAACQTQEADQPATTAWPDGLVTPVEDATFSLAKSQLPGAPRNYRAGTHQGFDFFNGLSGRPLIANEPIVAIDDGEIVRIDHDYQPREQSQLAYYSQAANDPGFVGKFALDQLRGRQVWIRHEEGHISRYAHLSEVHPELQPGDPVEQGQLIGLMGNTGIPETEDQPNPAPHLHFELWSTDGESYLGQNLTPLDTHRTVATLFSEVAVPRYAQRVIAQITAGKEPPDQYPPNPIPNTGFNAEPPERVAAGTAFSVPITWEAEEFGPNDFFALINGKQVGTMDAGDGAWVLGAAPLDGQGQKLEFVVGAIDPYGQTLIGGREIEITAPISQSAPREVSESTFARHTENHQTIEMSRFQQLAVQSMAQTDPFWQDVFHAPVAGEVIVRFGQRSIHGILRPQHPNPGLTIEPQPQAPILASNNGIIALAESLPIRGKTVAIIHGGGVVSVYANLEDIKVKVGEEIFRGHQLGIAGTNTESGNPEIQWEIHVAGTPSDPTDWLDRLLPGR